MAGRIIDVQTSGGGDVRGINIHVRTENTDEDNDLYCTFLLYDGGVFVGESDEIFQSAGDSEQFNEHVFSGLPCPIVPGGYKIELKNSRTGRIDCTYYNLIPWPCLSELGPPVGRIVSVTTSGAEPDISISMTIKNEGGIVESTGAEGRFDVRLSDGDLPITASPSFSIGPLSTVDMTNIFTGLSCPSSTSGYAVKLRNAQTDTYDDIHTIVPNTCKKGISQLLLIGVPVILGAGYLAYKKSK